MPPRYVTAHLARTSSTQDEARRRFAGIPVLVTADHQTAGRGRSGREWWAADRAVLASVAFAPAWPEARRGTLALVAALAAREVLPGETWLKWPNDLLDAQGAKVAGLLAEAGGDVVTVGLGANLWWPHPPDGAAGLLGEDPGPGAAGQLAGAWAGNLLDRAERGPDAWGYDEYRAACVTLGQQVAWRGSGGTVRHGQAVDIDGAGGLVVEAAGSTETLVSGEVREVRATLDRRRSEEPG